MCVIKFSFFLLGVVVNAIKGCVHIQRSLVVVVVVDKRANPNNNVTLLIYCDLLYQKVIKMNN